MLLVPAYNENYSVYFMFSVQYRFHKTYKDSIYLSNHLVKPAKFLPAMFFSFHYDIDALAQDGGNSIANAL